MSKLEQGEYPITNAQKSRKFHDTVCPRNKSQTSVSPPAPKVWLCAWDLRRRPASRPGGAPGAQRLPAVKGDLTPASANLVSISSAYESWLPGQNRSQMQVYTKYQGYCGRQRLSIGTYTLGWVKKAKFLIWAFLFAGQLQTGVRNPPKKFQIYRPINDRWQAISILGHF